MGIRVGEPIFLFTAGALLYVLAAAACVQIAPRDGLTVIELLVPLFGLPFVLLGHGPRWRIAIYLLLLVPGCHYLAVLAAIRSLDGMGRSGVLSVGAVGGLIGATLSFLALAALRMATWRRVGTMVAGIVVLTVIGHFGIEKMDFLNETRWSGYGLLLSLYLPWQVAFGIFLSLLLRVPAQSATADAPGACPNPHGAP